jgi:hypothetical protein
MTYRERRLRRADRLRGWAEKRAQKSAASFQSARQAIAGIEPGQPILVGHHSERRHRRDLERHDARMHAGFEHQQKAARMDSRADEIERQAEHAIYSDDDDAIERLRERIAGLEQERERIKAINRDIRRNGFQAAQLTEAERADLLHIDRLCPYHRVTERGYPAYTLQNLGGNLTRQRDRLSRLTTGQRTTETAQAAPNPEPIATFAAALNPAGGALLDEPPPFSLAAPVSTAPDAHQTDLFRTPPGQETGSCE